MKIVRVLKLRVLDHDRLVQIIGPTIVVNKSGDIESYSSIVDAVNDMESIDIEEGEYIVLNSAGTEFVLTIVNRREFEADLRVEPRPLDESKTGIIKKHLVNELHLRKVSFDPKVPLTELLRFLLMSQDNQQLKK